MKQLLKLIPLLFIGFYLITPTNVAASTGPPPNLHLKCGASDPVEYRVWRPQGSALSPTLNGALGDCEAFLPAKANLQSLVFRPEVMRTIVLENSADAETFVKAYWPETNCNKLEFHPLKDILIAQTVIPDYCERKLVFGCGNPSNLTVAPLQKINHDITGGQLLPGFLVLSSIAVGLFAGWLWKRNRLSRPTFRFCYKVIGFLLLVGLVFICSIIYFPFFANWLVYPSLPEFYIRLALITAVASNFLFQLIQTPNSPLPTAAV